MKKVLLILLSCLCAFGLIACEGSGGDDPATPTVNEDYAGTWYRAEGKAPYYDFDKCVLTDNGYEMSNKDTGEEETVYTGQNKGNVTKNSQTSMTWELTHGYATQQILDNINEQLELDPSKLKPGWFSKKNLLDVGMTEEQISNLVDVPFGKKVNYSYKLSNDKKVLTLTEDSGKITTYYSSETAAQAAAIIPLED